MTMEMQKLNHKVVKNVRNKIVISNLEREEMMKLNKRKQLISTCTMLLLILSGGFWSVNAATEGKLMEDIKEKYEEIIVVKLNQNNYEITTEKNEAGEEIVTYTIKGIENQETSFEFNKNTMEEENIHAIIEEDSNSSITLYDYQF